MNTFFFPDHTFEDVDSYKGTVLRHHLTKEERIFDGINIDPEDSKNWYRVLNQDSLQTHLNYYKARCVCDYKSYKVFANTFQQDFLKYFKCCWLHIDLLDDPETDFYLILNLYFVLINTLKGSQIDPSVLQYITCIKKYFIKDQIIN